MKYCFYVAETELDALGLQGLNNGLQSLCIKLGWYNYFQGTAIALVPEQLKLGLCIAQVLCQVHGSSVDPCCAAVVSRDAYAAAAAAARRQSGLWSQLCASCLPPSPG